MVDATQDPASAPGAPPGVPSGDVRPYPGALIVVEGIDGSGKSTQLYLLKRWLEIGGYRVYFTEWNSSQLVRSTTKRGKQQKTLTPTTFSLLHSADFADRADRQILPLLYSGNIVLADRYIYTLIARGVVRGLARDYLYGIYLMGLRPDLTFWLNISPKVAFEREFKKSKAISYWEAGLDLSMNSNLYESFLHYQQKLRAEFQDLSQRHGFIEINGENSVAAVNRDLRQRIAAHLGIKLSRYAPSGALSHLWR